MKKQRKIIQLIVSPSEPDPCAKNGGLAQLLVALCDDGSVWYLNIDKDGGWEPLSDIPKATTTMNKINDGNQAPATTAWRQLEKPHTIAVVMGMVDDGL